MGLTLLGVRVGAELSLGSLPGRGRKSRAFRMMHSVGKVDERCWAAW